MELKALPERLYHRNSFVFRVQLHKNQMVDAKADLVKTRTDLIYILIGPCVAIVVGLLVFLVNGVLTKQRSICGRKNLRWASYCWFSCSAL